ncbi:MAG TPA: hypothetical protein VHR47_04980, partial [Bacillota bacterium]|nr:hypothetical protein [Bacillota bacterium]
AIAGMAKAVISREVTVPIMMFFFNVGAPFGVVDSLDLGRPLLLVDIVIIGWGYGGFTAELWRFRGCFVER